MAQILAFKAQLLQTGLGGVASMGPPRPIGMGKTLALPCFWALAHGPAVVGCIQLAGPDPCSSCCWEIPMPAS